MKIQDVFWLSYKDLSEKKVRTGLTILMVMIGVASIIALTSLTGGIGASISTALQSLGPTSIIVSSTRATGFTVADTGEISSLPNVSTVIPILTGSATLYSDNQNTSVTVIGITAEGLQNLLGTVNLYQGTVYNDTIAPSSLIGHDVAFPTTTGGAQSVFIGQPATLKVAAGRSASSYTIPVVGILQAYGTSLISVDSAVVMSLPAAEALMHRSSFNEILVKATNTSTVTPLSNQIGDIYGSNARVTNTQELAATASSIVGAISDLLLVIASISLLVAAIGIMNIMLMSVLERTHEIGIMKSIGFKSTDVLVIFLVQAVMIGLIGGIIGIILGATVSYGLAAAVSGGGPSNATTTTPAASGAGFRSGGAAGGAGGGGFAASSSPSSSSSSSTLSFTPLLTITTIAEALFVAVIVSVIAGIYPAWRASQMQPIEALRTL